jgi:ABC-type antimicrobial peptide transport system ATPase subunit
VERGDEQLPRKKVRHIPFLTQLHVGCRYMPRCCQLTRMW